MSDSLFPEEQSVPGGLALLATLRRGDAPEIIAAFEVAQLLSSLFRPNRDMAGTGAVADSTRVFFGVEFSNNMRVAFATLAGLQSVSSSLPPGIEPSNEAVAQARVLWARHLLSRIPEAVRELETIVATGGKRHE